MECNKIYSVRNVGCCWYAMDEVAWCLLFLLVRFATRKIYLSIMHAYLVGCCLSCWYPTVARIPAWADFLLVRYIGLEKDTHIHILGIGSPRQLSGQSSSL